MAVDDHAIVVGIQRYSSLAPLHGPVADAKAFHAWLTADGGGAVPATQAALVLSPAPGPKDPLLAPPMLTHVQVELDRVQQWGFDHDNIAGRRLWLYLAGHGAAPDVDDAALLMANATMDRLYHLPAAPYLRWFRAAALFEEVVVVADCCRDELGGRLMPFAMPWADAPSPGAKVRYLTAFATEWSRKAREKPVDGTGTVRGVFTRALLEGLQQGRGTAKTLEAYTTQRVLELSERNEFQEPVFTYNADLQLSSAPAGKPCTLTVAFTAEDPSVTVEILDGALKVIASFPMAGAPRDLPVDPGLYAYRRSDRPADVPPTLFPPVTKEHEHVEV